MYIDPSGHFIETPPNPAPFMDGICLQPGSPGSPETSSGGGSGSGNAGGGGGGNQPGDVDEDIEKDDNEHNPEFSRCSGDVCVAPEDYYTVYFVPGRVKYLVPIAFQGINLTYWVNYQMEYKSDFGLQMIGMKLV